MQYVIVVFEQQPSREEKSKKTDNCTNVLGKKLKHGSVYPRKLVSRKCLLQPVNKSLHPRLLLSFILRLSLRTRKAFDSEGARGRVLLRPPSLSHPTLHLLTAAWGRRGAIAPDTQRNASVNGYWLFLWALLQGLDGKMTGWHRTTDEVQLIFCHPVNLTPPPSPQAISFKAYALVWWCTKKRKVTTLCYLFVHSCRYKTHWCNFGYIVTVAASAAQWWFLVWTQYRCKTPQKELRGPKGLPVAATWWLPEAEWHV